MILVANKQKIQENSWNPIKATSSLPKCSLQFKYDKTLS